MKAVSDDLLQIIQELQSLASLEGSSLGGGTNLAIRYNHRRSVDIDLFFPSIIGRHGFEAITSEVRNFYQGEVSGLHYPCEISDQYMFSRFFVRKGDASIKVEVLQNVQNHEAPDQLNVIRLMTENDISVLKLQAACNRATQKDIFDLDYLTEHIPLDDILRLTSEKRLQFSQPEYRTIFDLDGHQNPIDDPNLLLKFEKVTLFSKDRPSHSTDRLDPMPGEKNWLAARSSWRRKVRSYFNTIGHDFPSLNSF